MNITRWTFIIVTFLIGFFGGCAAPKPDPDPLAGWKGGITAFEGNPYGKAITEDYIKYVQSLPPAEKKYVLPYNVSFFEDQRGNHAVKIAIPLDGIWWEHVLIYDSSNQRVKTIKRNAGRYRS